MKNIIEKLLAREFIILVVIEILVGLKDVNLLLDTNNIILITSLLSLTTVKKFIDKKNQTEKVVLNPTNEKSNKKQTLNEGE